MNNPNKQYDLMKAFQIKSSDVFDIPKEFKKISLNVLPHGGSAPNSGDEIVLEGATGRVDSIKGDNVFINFPNTTRNFKLSLNSFVEGTVMMQGAAFVLEDMQDIEYSILLLKDNSTILHHINNNHFSSDILRFPISDKIFKFPSLYMWIPQELWDDTPNDKRLQYMRNYKKHQNILAVQKELAKNNIKISYKPLYEYLQYINNGFYFIHYPGRDLIQAVINCIINLIEIRTGLMKTSVEKKNFSQEHAVFIVLINDTINRIQDAEDRRLSVGSSKVLFTPITESTGSRRGSSESAESDRESATSALVKTYTNAHFSLTTILEAHSSVQPPSKTDRNLSPPPSPSSSPPSSETYDPDMPDFAGVV